MSCEMFLISLPAHETTKKSLGSVPVHQSRNRGHPAEKASVQLYILLSPKIHFRAWCTVIGQRMSLMPSLAYETGPAFTFPSSETGWQLWPAPLLENPSSSTIYRSPYKSGGLKAGRVTNEKGSHLVLPCVPEKATVFTPGKDLETELIATLGLTYDHTVELNRIHLGECVWMWMCVYVWFCTLKRK